VLADLPEEQRPVAERALQGGLPAVRQAVNEQNARLKAEGKPEVPAAGLLAMAEQLLPRLRVAEWLDRADAAKADIEELDLRDLRSVVAAGEDPMVARDETTRAVATELKAALVTKQESELALWFEDIDAAIGVGRVIRALKLSSQPPKAGVRFPTELAAKLATATTATLTSEAFADRWVAVLEAAAFSPIRTQIQLAAKPTQVSDELLATVKRVGPLLPQVAALFEIEVRQGAPAPKPLRPTRPAAPKKPVKAAPPAATKRPTPAAAPAAAPAADPLPAPEELLIVEPPEAPTTAADTPDTAADTPAVADAPDTTPAAPADDTPPMADTPETPTDETTSVAEAPESPADDHDAPAADAPDAAAGTVVVNEPDSPDADPDYTPAAADPPESPVDDTAITEETAPPDTE
jgi:hypothetical protein